MTHPTPQAPDEERLREFAASVFEQHGFVHNARVLRGSPDAVWVVAFMEILRRLSPSADLLAAAKAEERERCVKCCENEMPATQDTVSSQVCDALSCAIFAIRNAGGE